MYSLSWYFLLSSPTNSKSKSQKEESLPTNRSILCYEFCVAFPKTLEERKTTQYFREVLSRSSITHCFYQSHKALNLSQRTMVLTHNLTFLILFMWQTWSLERRAGKKKSQPQKRSGYPWNMFPSTFYAPKFVTISWFVTFKLTSSILSWLSFFRYANGWKINREISKRVSIWLTTQKGSTGNMARSSCFGFSQIITKPPNLPSQSLAQGSQLVHSAE